jgi:hypothetical protein
MEKSHLVNNIPKMCAFASLALVTCAALAAGCNQPKPDDKKDKQAEKTAEKAPEGKQPEDKQPEDKAPEDKAPEDKQPEVAEANAACVLPTTAAATPEETAWRIFVAINCASGKPTTPLVWQTWTEQTCVQNPTDPDCAPTATTRNLHASRLLAGSPTVPISDECSPMNTATSGLLAPFVPKNLAANPQFCEEVFVNQAELDYATKNSLLTLTGQNAYVAAGNKIDFPTAALEVKADWMPAAALTPDTAFNCDAPPPGLYTETINGTCYALVGMHISSKLHPNWLWATFEPQFANTNPNRCKADLYGVCNDAWGSDPAISDGPDTKQTAALAALMAEAKLDPAFSNYRLVGAQIDYVDKTVTELGNSFVEFNAQVDPHQASCITCHSYAMLDNSTTPPTHGSGGPPAGVAPIGPNVPQAPNFVAEDFSWFLGFMPAQ